VTYKNFYRLKSSLIAPTPFNKRSSRDDHSERKLFLRRYRKQRTYRTSFSKLNDS